MRKDRVQQVKTTKERSPHGDEHYKVIGKRGGEISPTKFTSETGRINARKRWDNKKEEINE